MKKDCLDDKLKNNMKLVNLPFIEPDEVEIEIETEIDPVAELKSRGDGYLSFNYNSGHLDRITIKLKNEQIVLLKGQTVIKKLPVGINFFLKHWVVYTTCTSLG